MEEIKKISDQEYIEILKECLEEAIYLMEDVRTGDYKPDSFTTQPWKNVLWKYRS